MIEGLRPYPSMKDSHSAFLGEVPEHWDLRRMRTLARGPIRNGVGESAQPYRVDWPRYIRITDIAGPRQLKQSTRASLPHAFKALAPVEHGELFLAAVGATYGKSYLHNATFGDACYAGYLVRWSPSAEVIPEWASYWTESSAYWGQVNSGVIKSTIENFSATRFRGLRVALPPPREQAAMVRFLDYVDRRIRRYIRAKQKLIKLLEEQKQAIIHKAVTRGLDPNVRLKPSGMEWLGEIPEHWDLVPNRALLRLEKRLVGGAWSKYPLLSLTKRGVILRDLVNPEGKFPTSFEAYQEVKPGDLVFCLFDIDETPRAVGLSTLHGMITGAYTRFLCDASVVDWVHLFYLAMDNGKRLKPLYTGLRKVITKSSFLSAKMPLPPASERAEIMEFVQGLLITGDEASGRARVEIALLNEFRTSLIADVVTGKLDVREAAAWLPAEVEEPETLDEVDEGLDAVEAADDALDDVLEGVEA